MYVDTPDFNITGGYLVISLQTGLAFIIISTVMNVTTLTVYRRSVLSH